MSDFAIRWGMSLLCVLVFCATLVLALQSADNVAVQEDYLDRLQARQRNLRAWEKAHIRLQDQLQAWNELWEKAQDIGLDPKAWQKYPVHVQGTYLPDQAGHILQLLSRDVNVGKDFWFAPRDIRASPVIKSSNATQGGKKTAVQLQIHGTLLSSMDGA